MNQQEVTLKSTGKKAILIEKLGKDEYLIELLNGARRPVCGSDLMDIPKTEQNEPEPEPEPIVVNSGSKPALGIVENEPDLVYFAQNADKPKIGSTMLKKFIANKKLFYKTYISKELEEEQTKACYGVGHYIEAALLEGDGKALSNLITVDCSSDKTKMWKEAVAAAPERSIIMLEKDLENANKAIEVTRKNKDFKAMMKNGKAQVVFRVDMGGFYLQCKVDWLQMVDEQLKAYDMKTTRRIYGSGRDCFESQVWNFGYHIQAAIYRMIMNEVVGYKPEWEWSAVETQEPFDFETLWMNPSELEATEAYANRHIEALRKCFDSGNWENTDGARMLMAPSYIIYQLGE